MNYILSPKSMDEEDQRLTKKRSSPDGAEEEEDEEEHQSRSLAKRFQHKIPVLVESKHPRAKRVVEHILKLNFPLPEFQFHVEPDALPKTEHTVRAMITTTNITRC